VGGAHEESVDAILSGIPAERKLEDVTFISQNRVMDSSPSPDKMSEVRMLVKAGNKIAAIKVYREITGVGLAEAKAAVEAMPLDPNAPIPPTPSNLPNNAARKTGCSIGMIAMSVGLVWAAASWLLR
jgi:hypothetical protein